MSVAWILISFAILALLYAVYAYNSLIRNRNLAAEAWSGIDVQLKRRYDLIPALTECVRGYAKHESGVLEEVAKLRSESQAPDDVEKRGAAEGAISRKISGLFALVESYPALKADKNFLQLQQDLTAIEEQIQYARRYYNGTVRNFNIAVESFPSNLVASAFGFSAAKFFEIELATQRQAPELRL